MNQLGLGVATLEHEQTGRTDPDAVDASLAARRRCQRVRAALSDPCAPGVRAVRRMLNDDDADEVAQDIFVRAWQS